MGDLSTTPDAGKLWVPPAGTKFDAERADKVSTFFEKVLVHTKGRWAKRPFILEPWQRDDIIRPLFGTVKYDDQFEEWVRACVLAWIELGRKNGKGLDVTTPVLTERGWSTMGDLRPGDQVHAPDGSLTRVRWVSRINRRPCFRVAFADGADLVCDDQHLWTVNDRKRGGRVIETPELARTIHCGRRGDRRYSVTVPDAVQRPMSNLPLDPYVLGAWLGDGASARGEITSADPEIIEAIEAAGFPASCCYRRGIAFTRGFPGLGARLRDAGVLGDKHVPAPYFRGSHHQRLRLLRGLMDTDGSVNVGPNTPRVEFSTTSHRLATGVLELARGLGWKATIAESRACLNGRDCGPRWRVAWTAFRDRSPFALERKTSKLASPPDRPTRASTNAVVTAERTKTVPTVCISVEHGSGTFLAGASLTPTHNSELVAGCGLYLLCADGEEEAEIYGCAKDRDQAKVVYQVAKRMVELSPVLRRMVAQGKLAVIDSEKRIVYKPTGSFYQVIPADGSGILGANPHGILFDEVITQPNRELWDALKTGMGARAQPLMLAATTAGNDPGSMAAEEHLHSERVLADPEVDPARFVYMRNTPPDVDWRLEENWHHANPALGSFLRIQVLRDEAKEAAASPSKQNAFRQFRLNQWVRQHTRWLDMAVWAANAGLVVPQQLAGKECYGGLDMASTEDFAAWVLVFPGAIVEAGGQVCDAVLSRFWLPAKAVERRKDMRDKLQAWAKGGFLQITPGDVLDLDAVKTQMDFDYSQFRILRVGYDRWGANEIIAWLKKHGVECEGIPQTTSGLNAATKDLERRLGVRQLRHGMHPVLAWMADNVEALSDANGNVKPDRKKSKEKIDGILALVDAIAAQQLDQAKAPKPAFAFVLRD